MSLYTELKRRNVLRVAVAYLAAAWLITEVTETIFPLFGYGDAPARIVVILMAIGFPLFLIFSWVFEVTPEGLKLEKSIRREESIALQTGKRIDRLIIVLLVAAVGYFAFDKFVLEPVRDEAMIKETAEQVRSDALVESFGDKSIAVLPFVNMSDDKDNEYFSDGISEELINLLSQIPELRVIARTSAFYYKDKNVKLTQVGEELGVNHILEGSVRKAGDRVRVTAQLIEAGSESHIWSETYDRTFADIFEIQDEIAVNVAERLKITLFGRQAKSKKVNPEAYALFLQASHFSFQWTPEGVERGFDLLQQAVTLDPNYARAWGAMAFKPYFEAMTGKVSYEEGLKNARRALGKALEIDPYDASSHAWMGFYLLLDWDYEGAAEFVQRALELNTADNGVRYVASILLGVLQRTEEAVGVTEQLVLRNPVEADLHASLGEQYLSLGRFDDALASFQMAVTLDPSFTVYLGRFQLMRGDAQSALEIVDGLESPAWDPSAGLLLRMMASYSLGKEEIYLAAQSELISRWGEYDPIAVACGFAWTEETDLAFDWLSKAVSSHSPFISSVTTNPCFKPIHYDPRWSTLLRQTGLAPEQMAAIQFNVPQSD